MNKTKTQLKAPPADLDKPFFPGRRGPIDIADAIIGYEYLKSARAYFESVYLSGVIFEDVTWIAEAMDAIDFIDAHIEKFFRDVKQESENA